MEDLLPKLKYLISYRNNSSYKYVLALSLIYCFDGNRKYTFEQLFRFIVPFYFNMAVRHKIIEKASGKLPRILENIINYSSKACIDCISEKDFEFLYKENARKFFICPLTCFESNSKISNFEGENTFFKYSIKEENIELSEKFYNLLSNNNFKAIIQDIVFFALVIFLEKYNNIPNIYTKISGMINERNLARYKDFFKNYNSPFYSDICYICGKKLWKDISIDHFIPFNYIANDEIWNLIPTHKNCNSAKTDKIGTQKDFNRLVERNKKLYNLPKTDFYYKHLQKELFFKYPNFENLYKQMTDTYNSCKRLGYKEISQ